MFTLTLDELPSTNVPVLPDLSHSLLGAPRYECTTMPVPLQPAHCTSPRTALSSSRPKPLSLGWPGSNTLPCTALHRMHGVSWVCGLTAGHQLRTPSTTLVPPTTQNRPRTRATRYHTRTSTGDEYGVLCTIPPNRQTSPCAGPNPTGAGRMVGSLWGSLGLSGADWGLAFGLGARRPAGRQTPVPPLTAACMGK